MKKRTAWTGYAWRLRTGAFGFYVEGGLRVRAAVRALAPGASGHRLRPRGSALTGATLLFVVLPLALWITDGSRWLASDLVDGRPADEVASLRDRWSATTATASSDAHWGASWPLPSA